MGVEHSGKLADAVAALGELSGRLGLEETRQAALPREVDALRVHMLWQAGGEHLESALRDVRGIVASAAGNRLAEAMLQEIDSILKEGR
jgi:hypothetical protein